MNTKDQLIAKYREFVLLTDVIGDSENEELRGKRINVRLEIANLENQVMEEGFSNYIPIHDPRVEHVMCVKCGKIEFRNNLESLCDECKVKLNKIENIEVI